MRPIEPAHDLMIQHIDHGFGDRPRVAPGLVGINALLDNDLADLLPLFGGGHARPFLAVEFGDPGRVAD